MADDINLADLSLEELRDRQRANSTFKIVQYKRRRNHSNGGASMISDEEEIALNLTWDAANEMADRLRAEWLAEHPEPIYQEHPDDFRVACQVFRGLRMGPIDVDNRRR